MLSGGCAKKDIKPVTPVDTAKTISIAQVFTSNMVIQRDKPVVIWGQAPLHTTVTVSASWDPQSYTAGPDAWGRATEYFAKHLG